MPLFLMKFKLLEHAREDCMTLFGGLTPEDDKADMGQGIKLIGRWSTLGEGAGFCICEADDAQVLGNWLVNWTPMVTITTVPIVDDNQAREIILKEKPSYIVDHSNAGAEAKDGESLFIIEYKFRDGCKEKGFETFANLSEQDDVGDAGNNTLFGRWHNLGTGSGIAICSSKSEFDLYTWANHWTQLCDCLITPVLSDAVFRKIMQNKPDFQTKRSALLDKMSAKPKKRSGWFS